MIWASKKRLSLVRPLFSRMLHTYFLMRRGLTLGVRAIVRSDDGKFLLIRHTYTPGWHFPGGGVEKGKTIELALNNELLQEVGLKIVGKPVLHGIFYNDGITKRDHIVAYLCDVKGDSEATPKSIEIAETGYFDPKNLPSDTDLGTVRRIREVVWGEEKTENW